jgi:hypothetical protein
MMKSKTKPKQTKTKKKGKVSKFIKIQAKPLTEEQIKTFVSYYKEHGSFPGSKIPCTVTGKLTTCMGPWMAKKIKEFGSAEALLRNYKCRGALKQEREDSKPLKITRKRLRKEKTSKAKEIEYTVPRFVEYKTIPIGIDDVQKITQSQCLRPDLFLSNNRNCEGCPYFANCTLHLKCLPKGVDFDGKNFVDSGCNEKKKKK